MQEGEVKREKLETQEKLVDKETRAHKEYKDPLDHQ